jgi:UPF0042 nucleotide-binding protein
MPKIPHSKWVIATKIESCTAATEHGFKLNNQCINIGDLCVQHKLSKHFGCKNCALNYWANKEDIEKDLKEVGVAQIWWSYDQPAPTKCSVSVCDNVINYGDICIKHSSTYPAYGCQKCGVQYAEAAWSNSKIPDLTNMINKIQPVWNPAHTSKDFEQAHGLKTESKVFNLTSFSVKNTPLEATNAYNVSRVWDVRKSVRNPWKDPVLRKLNGLDSRVQDYIARCPKSMHIVGQINNYCDTGYHNIYVGCFGGKHRSVAIVEMVAARLKAKGEEVVVVHRDLKVK